MATQKARLLQLLKDQDQVCGGQLLELRMPRYAARVADLKADGWRILNVGTCPEHKTARYELNQDLSACTLFCQCHCDSCVIFGAHIGAGHDTLEGPVPFDGKAGL